MICVKGEPENRHRMIDLPDFLPIIVSGIDSEGHITFSNGAELRLLNTDPDGVAGKHIRDVFAIDDGDLHKIVYKNDNTLETTITVNGRAIHFEHHLFPDYLGSDSYICYSINVTKYHLKAIEEEERIKILEARTVELEEQNRFKDKVLATIAHDLRGPINSLAAMVNLMNESATLKEDIEFTRNRIREQIIPLSNTIDSLFRWASLSFQDRRIKVNKRMSLHEIASDNVALLYADAENKRINIVNTVPENLSIVGNADQVSIVFRNIIANAIKFTPRHGCIMVSGSTTRKGIEIAITDTGVGMNTEQLNNLFKPVMQKSHYGTEGERGTGVGLFLCKEYIEANNGFLNVSSEQSKGSVFRIIFPFTTGSD